MRERMFVLNAAAAALVLAQGDYPIVVGREPPPPEPPTPEQLDRASRRRAQKAARKRTRNYARPRKAKK